LSKQCTCRKSGLKCVAACGQCSGDGCSNADVSVKVYETLDFDDATDEMDMLEIMMDDELNAEREEDVYDALDDCFGSEFFFDSHLEAELAAATEDVIT
jgi:hypothetical protein